MTKARDLANAGTALTSVSATELGYLDGVTSAVQTQINSKIGQSTAINPTIVDAKGDIIAATAADTVARLAVGANNTVLTADSAEATGLKWATPAGGAFVGCFLSKSATQALTTATFTALTFNTEDIDTDGFHSTVSNTSRITIPTGKDGKYLVTPQVRFEGNATGRRILALYKNGVLVALNQFEQNPNTGAITVGNSFLISLVATDYIELFAYQTSGGNLNANTEGTYFGVQYLGA